MTTCPLFHKFPSLLTIPFESNMSQIKLLYPILNMKHHLHFPPLSAKGLGLSMGLVWSLGVLIAGWMGMFGLCTNFIETCSSVYRGYSPSFFGAFIGAIWAFIHGFIKGGLLGYFYNLFTQSFNDPH